MPRKHITPDDYEKEKKDAAKRIMQYQGSLRQARYNDTWLDFLSQNHIDSSGKEHDGISSNALSKGTEFWEDVRNKVLSSIMPADITNIPLGFGRWLEEHNVVLVTTYRDTKGRFTSKITNTPVVSYRSKETGRFVSRSGLL